MQFWNGRLIIRHLPSVHRQVMELLALLRRPAWSPGFVGTWFFDNARGDAEQMAVFPDRRVVVLYSNGHIDETRIVHGRN